MKMKVVFSDGSWFLGSRSWFPFPLETPGTHHYRILKGSEEFRQLIGEKLAVPIVSVKYFVLDAKVEER
jgi:hypothetical protein